MKATLEFNLPEDKEEFNVASKAMDWAVLAWDIDQQCRNWIKYEEKRQEAVEDVLQSIRDMIHDAMYERGVSFPA
tara:strand:+ start:166 stop:390 length:225 start_codon:yes stop_codon:yes gene_type:complete